jgi:hypothetical protein
VTTTHYPVALATTHKRRVTSAPRPILLGADPDVVARACELLRALDRATSALTDALDVTGFPQRERQSSLALLSTLTSGLPAITLDDLIESLRLLAVVSGPSTLFPEAQAEMSLPDEARELLYLLEPMAAAVQAGGRLPKHAGARLRGAALTFTLSQPKTRASLVEVITVLRLLMRLPLQPRELTTLRRPQRPRQPPPPQRSRRGPRVARRSLRRAEPTQGAAVILLAMLIFALLAAAAFFSLVSSGSLPFGLSL